MHVSACHDLRNAFGGHGRILGLNGEHSMGKVDTGINYSNGHAFTGIAGEPCGFRVHIAIGILHLGVEAIPGDNAYRSIIVRGEDLYLVITYIEGGRNKCILDSGDIIDCLNLPIPDLRTESVKKEGEVIFHVEGCADIADLGSELSVLCMKLFGCVQCSPGESAKLNSAKLENAFTVKHNDDIDKFIIRIGLE